MAFLDETGLVELWGLIKAKDEALAAADVKIATGTYTGNGNSGKSSPNVLTFDFEVKFLLVGKVLSTGSSSYINHIIAGKGASQYGVISNTSMSYPTPVAFDGNAVSWYCENTTMQFNENNNNYYYVAIG